MLSVAIGAALAASRVLFAPSTVSPLVTCPQTARGWQGRITGPELPAESPGEETTVIRLVNEFRLAHHLGTVVASRRLSLAARAHDADMDLHDYFDHERAGLSFNARLARYTPSTCLAENIAWGTGSYGTPRGTVESWKQSPEHRRIMLLPWVRLVGVGIHRPEQGFQDTLGAVLTTADFSG
jgi:uncharacterized protein YkwD